MLCNVTNVVFINTFVVFVRLYWFEKRFQHVVKEAMTWRRTRSRGRTDTQGNEEDVEADRGGVNGRNIVVLDRTGRPIGRDQDQIKEKAEPESSTSSDDRVRSTASPGEDQAFPFVRNITFADDVGAPIRSNQDRLPEKRDAEQNIAFLEKQRNQNDGETLRIPGPREFDRGYKPEALRDDMLPTSPEGDDLNRHITVDTSNNASRYRARSNTAGTAIRKHGTARSQGTSSALERIPSAYTYRRGSGTWSRVAPTDTKDKSNPPYLSWQPTIGRNSAFIDLTEEQREELGGIEYRSLKLLALILMG
jgi:hypothetical protein